MNLEIENKNEPVSAETIQPQETSSSLDEQLEQDALAREYYEQAKNGQVSNESPHEETPELERADEARQAVQEALGEYDADPAPYTDEDADRELKELGLSPSQADTFITSFYNVNTRLKREGKGHELATKEALLSEDNINHWMERYAIPVDKKQALLEIADKTYDLYLSDVNDMLESSNTPSDQAEEVKELDESADELRSPDIPTSPEDQQLKERKLEARIQPVVESINRLRKRLSEFSGDDQGKLGFGAAVSRTQQDISSFYEEVRRLNEPTDESKAYIRTAASILSHIPVTTHTPMRDIDHELRRVVTILQEKDAH